MLYVDQLPVRRLERPCPQDLAKSTVTCAIARWLRKKCLNAHGHLHIEDTILRGVRVLTRQARKHQHPFETAAQASALQFALVADDIVEEKERIRDFVYLHKEFSR